MVIFESSTDKPSRPCKREELQTLEIFHNKSKRTERDLPQGASHTRSRPPAKISPITSRAAAVNQPKNSHRQVDTVGAKRPQ